MPPKGKGKGKGKTEGVIIDGVNTTEMTREQLEVFALRLKEENEREREERNFFQIERDKLRTFWEITRNELEEARAQLRNKDKEIEVANEVNDEKIKHYRQKVKHLQYEHQNMITELKTETMMMLKAAQDDHHSQETELLRDKRELKKNLKEQEINNMEDIKKIKMNTSRDIYEARRRFEEMLNSILEKYEKRYEIVVNEMETRHAMEMSEVEERKNRQITTLIEDHKQAFADVKNYYNDITLNNLALISSLKEQMEELNKQNQRMSKFVQDVTNENKRLVEPLKQAQTEAAELKRQLQNYSKDKISLANTKAQLAETQKELKNLTWTNKALELRFEKLEVERNALHKKFIEGILEVQQKSGLKNLMLQQKVKNLQENLESKEATLDELVAATKLEPHTVNKKLEALLKRKNTTIKDLQYELARITKAHDDLLLTYESKLQTFGIPLTELGFTPLKIVPQGQINLSKGPAGLITKNK